MKSRSFPAQLARTRRFTAGVPERFTVACDGAVVLFLRSRAGDDPLACLWALDLDTGTERLLADPVDLCQVSGHPAAGIESYATDRAVRLVAFALAGELWTVNVAAGLVRRLPAQVPVTDPCPDPAGRRVAYVCDGALRVVETARTGDRAIAVPDGPDVTFGLAKHAGDAALGGAHGTGVHAGELRGGTLVHVTRDAGRPGGRAVARRAGGPVVPIASVAERPALEMRETRLVLGPRDLRAALYLPSWHRPGHEPLPVLVDSYGGASRQRVTAERDWRCLVSQWFADQGFAVLVTDGCGTPGRGPDWEREVHGDLFGPVLDDQVTALQEAARVRQELDLGRVGIRGWSFGGSVAALAVLRRPDVFHAAVAGAGVTDQLLYSTHGRERFLGHPGESGPAYEACSLVREAPALSRPLLLMHGLEDDNVHPANTLRLSGALLAAGRPHEVLLLPGIGHQAMGTTVTESLLRYQAGFLRRHLGMPPR